MGVLVNLSISNLNEDLFVCFGNSEFVGWCAQFRFKPINDHQLALNLSCSVGTKMNDGLFRKTKKYMKYSK